MGDSIEEPLGGTVLCRRPFCTSALCATCSECVDIAGVATASTITASSPLKLMQTSPQDSWELATVQLCSWGLAKPIHATSLLAGLSAGGMLLGSGCCLAACMAGGASHSSAPSACARSSPGHGSSYKYASQHTTSISIYCCVWLVTKPAR